MWKIVNEQISLARHIDFKHTFKQPLPTSNDDKLFHIGNDEHQFFVKVAPLKDIERFECEAKGLQLLTEESVFLVPDCITTGCNIEYAFIVLEWLTLDKQPQKNWALMGQHLAMLHKKHTQAMFGFDEDNFCGPTLQPNRWHKKWDVFYAEERVGWQLQLLEEKGIHLVDQQWFITQVKEMLHNHYVEPSLLHGDLWRGNMGFVNDVPCIFDPACYYGDRECDLAMSELFGALPAEFYQSYTDTYPLSPGYEQRKKIYQLYPILNHANIFAGHYLTEAKQQIDNIIK